MLPANYLPLAELLDLPAPSEVCQSSLSARYRLIFAEDLDPAEWNDQATRPISPNALRSLQRSQKSERLEGICVG